MKEDRMLMPHEIEASERFYSVANIGKTERKTRKCLRCKKPFLSENAGHRVCAGCKKINSNQSYLSEFISVS